MEEEHLLCICCAKDDNLKQFIKDNGTPGKCKLCLEYRESTVTPSAVSNVFKALVRYHYSEWDYNTRWGGDKIEEVLSKENPIIETINIAKAEADDEQFRFENLIYNLTQPA